MNDYNYFFENSQLLNMFVAAFDDAFVYRYDARTRVAKEKIEVRYVNGPKHRVLLDLSDRAKTLTLPVVTIEQTSLARDPSRIHNKGQFIYRKQLDSTNSRKSYSGCEHHLLFQGGFGSDHSEFRGELQSIYHGFLENS
jgi:hypothetical protein